MPSPGPGPGPDSEPLYMMKNVPNSLPGGVSSTARQPDWQTSDNTDSLTGRTVQGWWELPLQVEEVEVTME